MNVGSIRSDLAKYLEAPSRRRFLQLSGVGLAGALGWQGELGLRADELKKNKKACIVLWMDGGPSQFETFTPKPGTEAGGPAEEIPGKVPGLQFSQNLLRLSEVADKLCVVRSMTAKDASHPRASYFSQTGYLPTATVKHPALGSHLAFQLGQPDAELPSVVSIGRSERSAGIGGGYLGAGYAPFVVASAEQIPDNTSIPTREDRFRRRLGLLSKLENEFEQAGGGMAVADHREIYESAARMILSPKMEAFDVSKEPAKVREAYGAGQFGAGCLVARRLIEAGVSSVQVSLSGWDMHNDCIEQCKTLAPQMDQAFAALLGDLDRRGMLDSTLVVWMGEFGRTPQIEAGEGRGHYAKAYTSALAGCGVKGGQAIGATDASGVEIVDRPVTVPDFLRTAFAALGLDADREQMTAGGRPLTALDGGEIVKEALA